MLQALVEKSLLRYTDERFWMLETIREFAAERLDANREVAARRDEHADCFLAVAARADPELWGPRQGELLELLEREHANFRAALAWAIGGRRALDAVRERLDGDQLTQAWSEGRAMPPEQAVEDALDR